MEYQVPQFIEVEDKIVGPLTLKQFIYIAGATGFCVVFFVSFSAVFAFLLSAPVVAFAAALAFYKVNGKPFIEVLEAGFNYYTGKKLLLWRRKETGTEEKNRATTTIVEDFPRPLRSTPRLTRGKLSELAWSLDVTSDSGLRTPDSGT
ncbi:PrgI family protein [Candidatus Kaiserbacteria bacterium]|nr:PrgI family protein [Candidatus Kaiserbacteria bacterium]